MKTDKPAKRRNIGRISKDTRGSVGPNMEVQGLWTKPDLNG
ncbi:MAG TPA: hypothetical protein VEB39_09060 [Sphingomicrobium sp.]|nr:hypothetical protein [Sphingomicrobium sp.]